VKVTDRSAYGADPDQVVEFVYDVLGNRIAKAVDSDGDGTSDAATYFVYNGDEIYMEYSDVDGILGGAANVAYTYLQGSAVDQVLAADSGSGVLWGLADHQGTIRDVVNNSGVVQNHIKYSSFGDIVSESNSSVDYRFSYTGREFDDETGLFYYRARYYDAANGKFISEDPKSFDAGDVNLYRYVGNNPMMMVDPEGMEKSELGKEATDKVKEIVKRMVEQSQSAGEITGYEVVNMLPAPDSDEFIRMNKLLKNSRSVAGKAGRVTAFDILQKEIGFSFIVPILGDPKRSDKTRDDLLNKMRNDLISKIKNNRTMVAGGRDDLVVAREWLGSIFEKYHDDIRVTVHGFI